MAMRKPAKKTAPPKRKAPKPPADPRTRLVEAALKKLARTAWSELTLLSVAKAAQVPPSELLTLCGSKPALFGLVVQHATMRATDLYVPEPGSAHDRLFEVAMAWFEALTPYKRGVARLRDGIKGDLISLFAAREALAAAGHWLLVLAEADTGPLLPLRALALMVALLRTVPVWLEDDADLSKTMARLDTDLRRGEILGRFGRNPDA